MVDVTRQPHPVKTERHDTQTRLHHTNTGSRPVNEYRELPHGLFVSRPFIDHPRIRHWQAHLLPALNLVVCKYDFHREREHDFYLDVAAIHREGEVWSVRDLYLDIVVHDGLGAEILDTDELVAAHRAGFISDDELHSAIAVAHHTLAALVRVRYDLNAWAAAQTLELTWQAVSLPEPTTAEQAVHA